MAEFDVLVDVAPTVDGAVDPGCIRRAVVTALDVAGGDRPLPPHPRLSVSVRLTDDEEMHRLNLAYRGVDRPTDVLSFAFTEAGPGPAVRVPPEMPLELGEIVLSLPYAQRQAADLGHTLDLEIAWLSVHGALQLVGYRHAAPDEASHMEQLEQEALRRLDLALP